MSATNGQNLYLYLGENPIRFEPLGGSTNLAIFFDQSNRQVYTVRSNGAGGVVVKGPDSRVNITFRLEDRGDIISMRFSSDIKVLAIQRSHSALDFVNFIPGLDASEYSQTCKGKGTKILGSCWTGLYEIVFVTDRGIEQYQVLPEKKMLKLLKTVSLPVNWFVWSVESSVLFLSSGSLGSTLHPFSFKLGSMVKLPKFDIEMPAPRLHDQRILDQRDVILAVIYGQLYALQILHSHLQSRTDIALYQITKDAPAVKTDILTLNVTGRLSVSILDNLIIVHHQTSKTSFLFDIRLIGEVTGVVTRHRPFLEALPVAPFKLPLSVALTPASLEAQETICDLYSQSCVLFPPDVVLDAKLGCFWYLHMRLEPLLTLVTDKSRLMDLLLLRQDGKSVMLSLLADILSSPQPSTLVVASAVFNKLNRVYHTHVEAQEAASSNLSSTDTSVADPTGSYSLRRYSIVDQSDMYTHIFSQMSQSKAVSYKFIVAVVIEYIRSLNLYQIAVQHFLYELVINVLVQHNSFYQLHQFLQYHVLSDSKHLACALLSLEGVYPPAYQLALDMLRRLSTASDSIIEVLLSKKQLLTAVRFVQNAGLVDQVSARKFLEASRAANNPMTFYAIFRFFEQRNFRLRGNTKFIAGEHCDEYVRYFQSLFPES